MAASLTALIIDDEPLARQELQYLLDRAGDVQVVGQGSNGIEAVELIRMHRPDVVFLDVRMPGLDGFAVLKKVLALDRKTRLPHVVFATAFDQYAVKAFEVNAVDYLLKPFDSKRVVKTLEKVRARVLLEPSQAAVEAVVSAASAAGASLPAEPAVGLPEVRERAARVSRERAAERAGEQGGTQRGRLWDAAEAKLDALLRMVEEQAAALGARATGSSGPEEAKVTEGRRSGKVVVRAQSRLLLVDQRDVCFASIEDGRITVVTKMVEGDSNVRTLEELMDHLDPEQFWRVHRSFVVNIQHIREVVPWFKSSYQLRMDDRKSTEIPVSRSQTKRLRELFNL
ncbi:MAG TPA: response regulator transcription factor [Acidobacteriaceae bacterium]|jgi:DNA-binding LytR/AlgR family response regulator|nr:response regulator transcription factor [Acidobacteriaceae bacterium]